MNITCGASQGSILGPQFLLMFFNDFEKCLKHLQSLNFADHTVVYVHGKTKDIVKSQLNEDLKNVNLLQNKSIDNKSKQG